MVKGYTDARKAPSSRAIYLALASTILCSTSVLAQTVSPSGADAVSNVDDSSQLQEIVVTAQRRSENLQNVPLSVSAFSERALTNAGVSTVRDLGTVDPTLNINSVSGSVLPFLRGVGNPSATTIGNEASVPIYIDEVYYTRLSPVYLELANVERVEVLKGPQGTLFGRNASGGLIQVLTPDPSFDRVTASAEASYANYNTFSGKFYLSVPVAPGIAGDLSVAGLHQGNGWGRNVTTGAETYRNKFISVRSKWLFELGENTRLRLIGYYAGQTSGQFVLQDRIKGTVGGTQAFYGPPQPLPSNAIFGRFYDAFGNVNAEDRLTSFGGSVKAEHDFGGVTLASITSYREADEEYDTEGDESPDDFQTYLPKSIDRQFTQELQLKSGTGSKIDWIVGAFYLDSKQGYNPTSVTGDLYRSQGLSELRLFGMQRIHSYSGYGQATFHAIPDSTNITLGLRYTKDYVRGVGSTEATLADGSEIALGAPYNKKFNFDKLTYKVAVDQRFAEHVMAYVSFSRGYKSGTFNTLPLIADPTRPEVVDAYEIGLKSELFDRRVRLNIAIFQNDIKDPQVQSITVDPVTGASFVGLTNADKARVKGVEVALDAALSSELNVRLGGVLLDPKFLDFPNAPFNFPYVDAAGVPIPPYGLRPPQSGDAKGNTLTQVAKVRLNGGASYTLKTAIGTFNFDGNISYTGRFPWDADNLIYQKAVTLINGSIQYTSEALSGLTVRVWGKNLTNRKYYASELPVAGGSGNIAVAAAPRTYGVTVGYRF